jgi:hypothetical protein
MNSNISGDAGLHFFRLAGRGCQRVIQPAYQLFRRHCAAFNIDEEMIGDAAAIHLNNALAFVKLIGQGLPLDGASLSGEQNRHTGYASLHHFNVPNSRQQSDQ